MTAAIAEIADLPGLLQGQANEHAAWADMAAAADAAWCAAHGLSVAQRGDGLALSLRSLPVGMFNRVFWRGPSRALDAADVDWALTAVPHHPVWVQPTPGEHEAASQAVLQRLGFAQQPMRWAKLTRWLGQGAVEQPAARVRVRELGADEGTVFGQALAGAMGLPPFMAEWSPRLAGRPGWHLYVASDAADQVVGCAGMYVHGDSAWLGMAATHPAARNQGAQRALMLRRLADAQQWGARSATTETGEPMPGQPSPSFHNMLACGFTVSAYRTNWKRA